MPHEVRLHNHLFEVYVSPSWGSNVLRMRDQQKGINILREPASDEQYFSRSFLYGMPVLFPPNRVEDGQFTYNHREYHFDINEREKHNHLHGFVHNHEWQVVSQDDTHVTTRFESAKFPEVERQFPHRFVLELTTTLEENSLIQSMRTENLSDSEMPFGLGYHTTCLANETTEVIAPVNKRWVLNSRNLPTGELDDTSQNIPLTQALDDVYLVDANHENVLCIIDRENGLQLDYACDENFTQWVIYNGSAHDGFVCPEPYTWVTNAPNLDLPSSLTGFRTLAPGASITCTTRITVKHI